MLSPLFTFSHRQPNCQFVKRESKRRGRDNNSAEKTTQVSVAMKPNSSQPVVFDHHLHLIDGCRSSTTTTSPQTSCCRLLKSNQFRWTNFKRVKTRKDSLDSSISPQMSHVIFSLFLVLVIPLLSQDMNLSLKSNPNNKLPIKPQQVATFVAAQAVNSATDNTIRSQSSGPTLSASSSSAALATTNLTTNNNNKPQTTATATTPTTTEFLLNLVKTNFNQQHAGGGGSSNTNNHTTTTNRLLAPFKPRSGQQREHMHYHTTFACEGNQLELSCQEGKLIHLVRANYGRFSLSICNALGHSNLSVQCASFRAFLIMETRCNKLSNCSVIVSKELFGDPCEGTSKYLEVQYFCDDVNNNNQQIPQIAGQQQQVIIPPNQRPLNHNQQPQSSSDSIGQQVGSSSLSSAAPTQFGGGHKSPPTAVNQQMGSNGFVGGSSVNQNSEQTAQSLGDDLLVGLAAGTSLDESRQPTNTVIQQTAGQYCVPQTSSRNLYWNLTRAGQLASQSCPDGSTGKASWLCDAERSRFAPAWSPDFTQCRSTWLLRLAHQLDQMLETPSKQQQSAELSRQQNEQILKVLDELGLMARTKELFSEDLKRIDIMISQIISQLRSLSVVFGGINQSWRTPNSNSGAISLYEELFSKLVSIVSSLFDVSQRSAWLDVQPNELRRRLEQRFLNHLKDSGVLVANTYGSSSNPLEQQQQPTLRQPNVFAGITVINNSNSLKLTNAFGANADDQTNESNEFNLQLKQSQLNLNRFVTDPDDQINEFRIHMSILRELVGNGITRFLVLDVKKPDYSLIRQQLELSANADGSNQMDNNLVLDQQWSSRVFGVFAIVGENGDVFDGHANNQQEHKLADLLAQWPISVDFKVSPLAVQVQSSQQSATPTATGQQQVLPRQCNSLSDSSVQQPNRCHTFRSNATNHICRCDHFGFVSLVTMPNQIPASMLAADFQWPLLGGAASNSISSQDPASGPYEFTDPTGASRGIGGADSLGLPPSYIGAAQNQGAKQQAMSIWTTIFVAFGLLLLLVSLAAFVINATLRASSQSRLDKKQQGFLSTGPSILGHHLSGQGPTTGPLTDHSLMSNDPIVAGTNNTGTTQSTSIIGLTQSACHGYKAHQQLYAAHLPPIDTCHTTGGNRWSAWTNWLRPSRWLSVSAGGKGDHMVQHRVIGSSLTNPGSVSYKSQYQNGYTTGLHQTGRAPQLPLAAPSSSTSSYVSSSAYYEEIGPGNLTKVNTNQLSNGSRTHTIVDPFKRQTPAADQQQLLSSNTSHHHHHHHHHQQQQQQLHYTQTNWSSPSTSNVAAATTTALSYSLEQPQHQGQHHQQQHSGGNLSSNYGQPVSMLGHKQQLALHHDLSQLQAPSQSSSQSSAGSQHSASTNVTTANGSTPRHYLFASPSAVSAYKSSMSQQTLHNHQQQQQQHYHQQQQQLKDHHRFMQS